jgi:lipopolysaccharide transport system ATP-binding protein
VGEAETIIRVDNLSKKYVIRHEVESQQSSLRESVANGVKSLARRVTGRSIPSAAPRSEEFWALRDVSFDVGRGEVVGVVGRNGGGKSTLLKILSRITDPTLGRIEIEGRVASLLEVGTGFHPELTGRENIFLNGTILGMSRAEIRRKFDEIVAFAEIDKFLDTPVKRYSSGMYVRLAFAVAAHLDPEILILDEVLAVGDTAFQKKCLGKMGEVARGGRTVLFVSHNMAAIHQMTSRCVYLQSGRVVCVGPTAEVAERYISESFAAKQNSPQALDYYRPANRAESTIRFRQIRFVDVAGRDVSKIEPGDPFHLEVTIESQELQERACLTFWLTNDRGERISIFFSGDANFWFPIETGSQRVRCAVAELPLSPGRYTTTVGVNRTPNVPPYDAVVDYPAFDVDLPAVKPIGVDWSQRRWGSVHWTRVAWERSAGGES